MDQQDRFVNVQGQWILDAAKAPAPANQIVITPGATSAAGSEPDEFVVTFGHVSPPLYVSGMSDDEAAATLSSSPIPIVAVGRFTLTRDRLLEFADVFQQVAADVRAR